MSDTTPSINMNLPVPVVSTAPGPEWAESLNACLTLLDAHTHVSGSGLPITPSAININADLEFNNQNLTEAKSLRLYPQGSNLAGPSDLGCLYENGVDLYYNDGDGNQIRLTQSGSVAGASGSIGSLSSPASATYVSGSQTFVWQSGANTAANMDGGSVILRNLTASSKGLTLNPPNAMGVDFAITLPTLPASQEVLTLDNSGAMATVSYNDVADARTRATGATVGLGGIGISPSSAGFSTTSSTFIDVTNLTCQITSSGRPIRLELSPADNVSRCYVGGVSASDSNVFDFQFLDNGSGIGLINVDNTTSSAGATTHNMILPPGAFSMLYDAAPGVHVFSVQVRKQGSTSRVDAANVQLIAYEL